MQVYQGYQLIFFTQQNCKLDGMTVAEWLLKTAKDLGIPGATMSLAQAGYGRMANSIRRIFLSWRKCPKKF